ncbi:MAG: GTPase [Candidatus Diapherotrites archaeon]|nr:GTPase [Candidatus Diapherotrites archaeon]
MTGKKVIILGAAGMDYHVFNTYFRDNPEYEVVGFTAAAEQNLGTVEGGLRRYPPELAGKLYPEGIPTFPEDKLEEVIQETGAEEAVLAYSDVSHEYVMHLASRALASGANFRLLAPKYVMLKSKKPVISVCAVRTGCGKSQTSRWIALKLKEKGLKVVVVREPMPYGDLTEQVWQRFATLEDLKKYKCTVEEMEEYEPHITHGLVVYAGVDYSQILKHAEEEADVVLWDGGNNEISFFVPDVLVTVVDPLRPGHETKYHPGEVNLRMADVVVVNKEDSAKQEDIDAVIRNVKRVNPNAKIVHANSVIKVNGDIKGKKVLVVEDGPTVTHGGMSYGAGFVAAKENGCDVIDPRPYAADEIQKTFEEFPHLKNVLPAMGYSEKQLKELEETVNAAECDLVVSGTPIDLGRILKVNKPIVRVTYELEPKDDSLDKIVDEFAAKAR